MKTSEAIKRLQELIDEHGDLPLNLDDTRSVERIEAYTSDGKDARKRSLFAVEICIHGGEIS